MENSPLFDIFMELAWTLQSLSDVFAAVAVVDANWSSILTLEIVNCK